MKTTLAVLSLLCAAPAFAGTPKPLKKPPTAWKADGASLSSGTLEELGTHLGAKLKTLGYELDPSMTDKREECQYEGLLFTFKRTADQKRFDVYVMRPAATVGDRCGDSTSPASYAKDPMWTGAKPAYDSKADVVVQLVDMSQVGKTVSADVKAKTAAELQPVQDALLK